MTDYAAARLNMVEGQLRTNRITDPGLIEAFLTVPRERFVPAPLAGSAYVDADIPLGPGRCLVAPLVLAQLLQLAEPQSTDRALYLGAATGYGPAILAHLVGSVTAVEPDSALAAEASRLLTSIGASGIRQVEGPLDRGDAAGAPYDIIVFGGAIAAMPDAIIEQLAPQGRAVAILTPDSGVGQATVMTRAGGVLSRRSYFDAATLLLPGLAPQPGFTF